MAWWPARASNKSKEACDRLNLTLIAPPRAGTGMIIVVGVAIELNAQIDGLLAGKSFEQVQGGM